MTRFISSLRFRLLFLVLLALVPALVLIIYDAADQRGHAAARAEGDALHLAGMVKSQYEDLIADTRELLIFLAKLPDVRTRDRAACSALIGNILELYPRYSQFSVAWQDQDPICSGPCDKTHFLTDGSSLSRRVFETRDLVGEWSASAMNSRSTITLAYPIFDDQNQVQGMLTAAVDLSSLDQLVSQLDLPPGSAIAMRDNNGAILARFPDPGKWVGQSLPAPPIVQLIKNSGGEGTAASVGIDNVRRLYGFTSLAAVLEEPVYISVGIPVSVAFAGADQALLRNLIALGLVTVLVFGAAWVGADLVMLRPVTALLGVTNRLARGDLSARTGLRSGVGELDTLAHAFDQMVDALEQREKERRQADVRVRQWSSRLEGFVNAIGEVTAQPLDPYTIVDIALHRTCSVMGLPAGCALLKHGEDLVVVNHCAEQKDTAPRIHKLKKVEGVTSELASVFQSDVVQEIFVKKCPIQHHGCEDFSQDWTSVPIKSKGRVLGVMCLAKNFHTLEPQEQSVLAALGQQVGVSIENAELYDQVQSIAVLKERERLSRELHDGLAQVLGYLTIRTKVASELVAKEDYSSAWMHLQEMQRTMQEVYQDIRESILGLRTTITPNRGLVPALKEYLHKFGLQTGIRVNLSSDGCDQFEWAPEAEVQLLRIIQEALSNVRKHSLAKQAWIRMERDGATATVTIEDNGQGFDLESISRDGQTHFGLQTMKERAQAAGGSFEIWSKPGLGTKIRVALTE